jgi:hypothetical protein
LADPEAELEVLKLGPLLIQSAESLGAVEEETEAEGAGAAVVWSVARVGSAVG